MLLCRYPLVRDDRRDQDSALLDGVEYTRGKSKDGSAARTGLASCAVCQAHGASTMVQWGRQTCAHGYSTEYKGSLMTAPTRGNSRARAICVDAARSTWGPGTRNASNFALLREPELDSSWSGGWVHTSGTCKAIDLGRGKYAYCAAARPAPSQYKRVLEHLSRYGIR